MTSESTNSPSPAFRSQLEWEVTRAFRREARLGARTRDRRQRWLRAATLVAVSVAVGATAGLASAQVRESVRRDSLLDAARAELSLTQLRLQLAQAAFADVTKKIKIGAASSEGLVQAERDLRAMEARLAKSQLNILEIRATSLAARDELNAPLVNGRDFVLERIQFDLQEAQLQLVAAEAAFSNTESRFRTGVSTELAQAEAQLDLEKARRTLALLAERMTLRREFVERATPADQLMTRLGVSEVRLDALLAQKALELSRLRLKTVENQRAIGAADEVDVMRARIEVKERELDLQRFAMQLQRLSRTPPDSNR
jgi:hypothetical protein